MTSQLTPAQIAAFDQAKTTCADVIDGLIDVHRTNIARHDQRDLHTVGLAMALLSDVAHKACAELLAVAIDRLALGDPDHV
jgi:hypothetical protein